MNQPEAARVIAFLAAAWPNQDLPEATIALWADTLDDIPVEYAVAVAKQIVKTDEWFPSIARFRQVWLEQRRRARMAEQPALPAGRASGKEHLAELRATLAKIGQKP